jgi:hypothetical protein
MIRSGWKVLSSDGQEVGRVDEVTGDETQDIFDGLAVATSALSKPRYVPAERVATIVEGIVNIQLTRDQFEHADEYLEPPTSVEIEPDDHRGIGEALGADVRRVESAVERPQRQAHEMNVWRRLWLYFRRGNVD